MISPKIKSGLFKALSSVSVIVLVLITCEAVLYPLTIKGKTIEDYWPSEAAHHERSLTPLAWKNEVKTSEPQVKHPPNFSQPGDKKANFPTNHLNLSILDINMPFFNFHGQVTKKHSKTTLPIYSVEISTDDLGRRITPNTPKQAKQHIAIMGCSYAFGEAVNDNETLAYYLQQKWPETFLYNLSFSGYGANDIIARTLKYNFMQNINPPQGNAVYLFTDNHIKRSIGAMSVIGHWGYKTAALKSTADNNFAFFGTHKQVFPIRTALLRFLWNRNTIKFFKMDWPFNLTSSDYDLFSEHLKMLEKEYKNRTHPNNKLVVVIYPESLQETNIQLLKKALEKQNITFVDYSTIPMNERISTKANVDFDGHPTSDAYKHLAEMISTDLSFLFK